jgi:hypothetical protein
MSEIPMSEFLIELEKKYVAMALKEIEARELQDLPVTPEFLNKLEEKQIAMALKEVAHLGDMGQSTISLCSIIRLRQAAQLADPGAISIGL